MHYMRLMAGYI